ncbi:MAG: alginate export family protein [Candidatus Omnitrophica bacterium]|nr:alginate export family protein [Candidatus Omnitrophota bacterium]
MRKFLLLAVLMVAVTAVPASASVQNIKISGSIDNTFIHRNNFDFGLSTRGDSIQNLFVTQTTLQVDADLTENVSATVGLINERDWRADAGAPTEGDSNVDLYLAYVTLREMLYSPMTVVVGRQLFSYGNSLIVDATGTNNLSPTDSALVGVAKDLTKQTSQDAIRLIFDYNPLTVELLYSKINPNTGAAAAEDKDDHDLYGINTTYELGDDLNTVVEAYFFASYNKVTEGNATGPAVGKVDTIYTPGVRASVNILEGLNLQAEFAHQSGTKANSGTAGDQQSRNANAAQFIANYSLPDSILPQAVAEMEPVANYTFTYVSGDHDKNAVDGSATKISPENYTAWDPLYEAQGAGTIYNSLFDLTNLFIHSVSLQVKPMEDITTKLSWHGLWLDKEVPGAIGTTAYSLLRNPTTTAGLTGGFQSGISLEGGESYLGYEVDWETTYDYTEDVQFGVNLGVFNPGDVFTGTNSDAATQAIVHGNVIF